MTVKEKLKELFEKNRGKYLSGEEIAADLGCTRGAVWKAVRSLEDEGYRIAAVTNKGYCMLSENDIISEEGIKKYLSSGDKNKIVVLKQTDSTNLRLKEIAAEGAPEGTLVVAGEQTAGRGRLGRTFASPPDSGVYMSLLLRPEMGASDAIRITTAAAVAVAEVAEQLTGRKTGIKWVNDIYCEGRKVCGILTEASFNVEFGGFDYAVLGIGINVYEPEGGFPDELKSVAGALLPERVPDLRNRMIAGIVNRFTELYENIGDSTYLDAYEKRLMWKGEKINIISPKGTSAAVLKGIDHECGLVVEYPDGTEGVISSGEISIRKK